jgi:hypothetical protein
MKKLHAFLFGLVLVTSSARADERLEYSVKVAGVEFGTAVLFSSGSKLYGELVSGDKWGSVYSVDNRMASQVGPDGTPVKTELTYKMKGKTTKYDFMYSPLGTVKVTKWRPHKVPQKYTSKSKLRVNDLLTMINHMKLNSGKENYNFSVITGTKVYDVNLKKSSEQDLDMPIGIKKTSVYDILITRPGGVKEEMRLWVSSEDATLLKLAGKTNFGFFEVTLAKKLKEKNNADHVN